MSRFWTLDPVLFGTVFGLVFLAELPDKTALAALVLATRRHPVAVFLGAAAAFVAQSLIAVIFGGALNRLPAAWVRVGAGLLFLGFAWSLWFHRDEEDEAAPGDDRGARFWRAARSAFVVIFVAEWGDLTQLATATLVAKHGRPLTIFLAATAALWSVAALAVAIGHRMKGRFHPPHVQKAASAAFALAGLGFLLGFL